MKTLTFGELGDTIHIGMSPVAEGVERVEIKSEMSVCMFSTNTTSDDPDLKNTLPGTSWTSDHDDELNRDYNFA
jgi:hypothetical protein